MNKIFAKNKVSYNHLWISFTQHPMDYRHAKRSRVALHPASKLISSLLIGLVLSWAGQVVAQTAPPASQTAPTPEATPPGATTPGATTPAATPPAENSAPPELLETLAAIDAAATQHDLEAVMNYYSPSFANSDGLTYESLEQTLSEFWERYPTVIYETQLNDWQADGNAIVAETTTTITGVQTSNDQPVSLTATITSRQRFENSQIVEQEILSEQSQLAQGENPPDVNVILPDQVAVGESFEFDAIVQEPLGNRLLLGAALEEPVQPNGYFDENPVTLELLSSGGLFKIGEAPATPDTHWVSAILIRDDGITTVTRRLQVVPAGSASQTPAEP